MAGSSFGGFDVNRRNLIRGAGLGAVSLAGTGLLAACSTGSSGGGASGKTGSTTFGSNASDAVPKKAFAAFVSAFEKKSGDTVKTTTTDHNGFQEKISNYLQGSPDDVITWFAGYRVQYYAKKGLLGDITDVWDKIGGNYSDALKQASTVDGKQYFVPNYNYPWGVFYRKSFWQSKGWEVPTTYDELISLCKKMKAAGIIPIAFADKDGWPAMGTFDYLNLRINGYQFHVDLLAHNESWNSSQVKEVFDTWKELREYQDPTALGLTWQEAADKVGKKTAGMYLLGSFVTQQFTDADTLADIDFFPFPAIKVEGTDSIEAPIDGLMLSKRGATNQVAKDMLAYLGTGEGQLVYNKVDPANIMTAKDADTSGYSTFVKKLADVIANAKHVTQFFDRDADPAMASNVMIPTLQTFTKSGTVNLASVEKQAAAIYANA